MRGGHGMSPCDGSALLSLRGASPQAAILCTKPSLQPGHAFAFPSLLDARRPWLTARRVCRYTPAALGRSSPKAAAAAAARASWGRNHPAATPTVRARPRGGQVPVYISHRELRLRRVCAGPLGA